MKLRTLALSLVPAATIATLVLSASAPRAGAADDDAAGQIERGKYLVSAGACHDCHTPWKMGEQGPEPDMSRMLSGHPEGLAVSPATLSEGWEASMSQTHTAWTGPWGVSFTANLTPDPETGLGKWTSQTFMDTIRNGRHMGRGRQILPPMPWPMYRNLSDSDLQAIFAYLQSVPAVRNKVPEPMPPPAAP